MEPLKPERGVSLAQDAWRRLRKSWTATAALWTLAVLSGLAVLAPLLPLQPPRLVETHRGFEPPTLARPDSPLVPPEASPEQRAAVLAEGFGRLDPVSSLLLRSAPRSSARGRSLRSAAPTSSDATSSPACSGAAASR
jgi:hypothetical protein